MKSIVYIGSYTGKGSKGLYRLLVDNDSGQTEIIGDTFLDNPSYACLSADGKFLYAVMEVGKYKGEHGGALCAYAVGPMGELTYLNEQPTYGSAPCHISTSPENKWLFCANYGEGTATICPIGKDGKLGAPSVLKHEGSGPDKSRQEKPHVHFAHLTPDNNYLALCDLGLDGVFLSPFSEEGGVDATREIKMEAPAASGPRHLAFSPDGKFAYLVTEMAAEVVVYAYEAGKLTQLQVISMLPEDYTGFKSGAAIRVSPDGRFVCASNRGHDSLAVFARKADGTLDRIQIIPSGGVMPRDFAYLPGGKFLFVAHQMAGLNLFSVDTVTGMLTDTGKKLDLPGPVSVLPAAQIQ